MLYHAIETFRSRALTPDNPVIRGTAANPDTYFQCREAINIYYDNAYQHIVEVMNYFASATGRQYTPYEYYGADNAEHIIALMGSAAGMVKEVIDVLLIRGKKVGILIVHLFRPFSAQHLLHTIPKSVSKIAALDRTKEAGAQEEPLYLDIMKAKQLCNLIQDHLPLMI